MDTKRLGTGQVLLLVLYAALVVAVDAVGVAVEVHAVSELAVGHLVPGLWYLAIGLVGIGFFTYAVGYGMVVATLRA